MQILFEHKEQIGNTLKNSAMNQIPLAQVLVRVQTGASWALRQRWCARDLGWALTSGAAFCLLLVAGCANTQPVNNALSPRLPASSPATVSSFPLEAGNSAPKMQLVPSLSTVVKPGTGVLMNAAPDAKKKDEGGTPISLSFENGDIREIVKNILGDLLGLNLIIDPRVQGTITIRTAKPISRSDIIPLLETVLRSSNAALVQDGAYWRVLPATEAVRGFAKPLTVGQSITNTTRGTSVVVYPAQFVGAKELMRILEPFARDPASTLRIDELRNFVFMSGPQSEVDRLIEIAGMFDINLLEGMSFALITLQGSDTKTVMADFEKILGSQNNPFAGLLRIIPLERMNALLIVSAQARVVEEARTWIERLDAGGGDAGNGQKLFVYTLQYTQAEKLQPILQAAISGRGTMIGAAATVAPGQRQVNLSAPVSPLAGQSIVQPGNASVNAAAANQPMIPNTNPNFGSGVGTAGQQGAALARNATIVADKDRNSLLIVATQSEFNAIESVIKKLDVAPKQVAIEVQIAEVSLSGDFQFGLQSYFQGKLGSDQNRLTSENGFGSVLAAGFSYTWRKTDAIQAILNLSEAKNKIRTISQPTLITLENQKASFSAGTQISVRTQTSTTTGTVTSTDSFQYINTGIDVNVTPRVSGKNVFLEIQQDISDAGVAASGNPNPPIIKRSASTNVMVASGDTMIMGGLFQEGSRTASSGLPLLSGIPVIGGLFGSQHWQSNRTELVLLITPRVLSNEIETQQTVDEIRKRMSSIEDFGSTATTKNLPTSAADKRKLAEEIRNLGKSLTILPTPSSP